MYKAEWEASVFPVVDDLLNDVNTIQIAVSDCENENLNGETTSQWNAEHPGEAEPPELEQTQLNDQIAVQNAYWAANDMLMIVYTNPLFDASTQTNTLAELTDVLGAQTTMTTVTISVDGQWEQVQVPQFDPGDSFQTYSNWTGQGEFMVYDPNTDVWRACEPGDQEYQLYATAMQKWEGDTSNLSQSFNDISSQAQASVQYDMSVEKQLLGTHKDGFSEWSKGVAYEIQNQITQ